MKFSKKTVKDAREFVFFVLNMFFFTTGCIFRQEDEDAPLHTAAKSFTPCAACHQTFSAALCDMLLAKRVGVAGRNIMYVGGHSWFLVF